MNKLELADDMLFGAEQIAEALYGDPKKRRRVYQIVSQLPVFHMGQTLCARRSSLLRYIENLESQAAIERQEAR
jgi:hypothetical protein